MWGEVCTLFICRVSPRGRNLHIYVDCFHLEIVEFVLPSVIKTIANYNKSDRIARLLIVDSLFHNAKIYTKSGIS